MNTLQSPSSNFNAVRDGRNAPDFYFDLDLSAVFDTVVNIAGNSLYADANPSDGVCTVYFQDTASDRSPTPFYVSPGFIARIPFTQIRVRNTLAQPGKKLRIVYGTDTDFQPGSVAQVAIATDFTPITEIRAKAGNAGIAYLAEIATAGEYPQLFVANNQSGPYSVIVRNIKIFNPTAASVNYAIGTQNSTIVTSGAVMNKSIGGAAPAYIRQGRNTNRASTVVGSLRGFISVPANTLGIYEFDPPSVIPSSSAIGLGVISRTVNIDSTFFIECEQVEE